MKAEDVERFCAVVGNQGESFKAARNEKVLAPMDFAIVAGWQVCRSKCPAMLLTDFRYPGYYEVYFFCSSYRLRHQRLRMQDHHSQRVTEVV